MARVDPVTTEQQFVIELTKALSPLKHELQELRRDQQDILAKVVELSNGMRQMKKGVGLMDDKNWM